MSTTAESMSPGERRAALSLAGIYALRMLGLFMILPVFALYAQGLAGYTHTLTGLAIGVYGLTQAMLQIPLGMLSDRIGRKPVIIGGLLVFALGSVVAAMSDTMWGVILGRALQGTGAIAAAVMALAADLTREEHRLKVMAIIGLSIGMAFAAAMALGPILDSWIGVPGIFWLTAVLALGGIAVVRFAVPQPAVSRFHRDTEVETTQFSRMLLDSQLLRLDLGILVLHLVLTATFTVIPLVLRDQAGLAAGQHWMVYLPVMVFAIAAMLPFILLAERGRKMKQVFVGAIGVLLLAELGMEFFADSLLGLVLALWVFFTAFNLLEASLPSLVAKMAPAERKGTAMGVYSSAQFLGAFLGGLIGGILYEMGGPPAVFAVSAALLAVWLLAAATMRNPRYLSSYLVNLGTVAPDSAGPLAARLTQVRGVAEAVVIPEDGTAYLKVDLHALDREALRSFSTSEA